MLPPRSVSVEDVVVARVAVSVPVVSLVMELVVVVGVVVVTE